MKRKTRSFISIILYVSLLLVSSLGTFAQEFEYENNEVIKNEIESAVVPEYMEPGSIVVYNDNLEPEIKQGGYATTYKNMTNNVYIPVYSEITDDMSIEEIEQIKLENELTKYEYEIYLEGEFTADPPPKIYPGMKVIYNKNTGEMDKILYPDKNELSGYSITNPFLPEQIFKANEFAISPRVINQKKLGFST